MTWAIGFVVTNDVAVITGYAAIGLGVALVVALWVLPKSRNQKQEIKCLGISKLARGYDGVSTSNDANVRMSTLKERVIWTNMVSVKCS